MLILDEDEVDVDGGLEYAEAMDVDDKTKVESQEGQAIDDEGDPTGHQQKLKMHVSKQAMMTVIRSQIQSMVV